MLANRQGGSCGLPIRGLGAEIWGEYPGEVRQRQQLPWCRFASQCSSYNVKVALATHESLPPLLVGEGSEERETVMTMRVRCNRLSRSSWRRIRGRTSRPLESSFCMRTHQERQGAGRIRGRTSHRAFLLRRPDRRVADLARLRAGCRGEHPLRPRSPSHPGPLPDCTRP